MQPNPRVPDRAGMSAVDAVRARVPDEVSALRGKLDELRAEHTGSREVLDACDLLSAALDGLIVVLLREWADADGARRQGHR